MQSPLKNKYVVIPLNDLKPVVQPGLSSPRHALNYHDHRVQDYLIALFNGIFPAIVETEEGLAYQLLDNSERDRCSRAKIAQNIADIPRAEVLRLMEGWIRMHRRLQGQELESKVQSILLNFRVPDPKKAIQHYRIEKIGDQKRLIILWGFESEQAPCISIERALSYLLEVPIGHLRSILSTSMISHTGVVTSAVHVDTSMIESYKSKTEQVKKKTTKPSKRMFSLLLACACVLVAALIFFLALPLQEKEQQHTQSKPEQPIADNTLTVKNPKSVKNISAQGKLMDEKKEEKSFIANSTTTTKQPKSQRLKTLTTEQEKVIKPVVTVESMTLEKSVNKKQSNPSLNQML